MAPKPSWAAPTFVILGPNTLVTVFGQSTAEINSPQQISVGSSIDAFGIVTSLALNDATLDASAGRLRLDPTTASGLVIAQGSGALDLNLASLDGRSIAPFDFCRFRRRSRPLSHWPPAR